MSGPGPTPSTPPSVYLTGIGTLVEGGAVATFIGALNVNPGVGAAVAAAGGVLIGLGAWMHTIGH